MAGLLDSGWLSTPDAQLGLGLLAMGGGNLGNAIGGLLQQQAAAEDRKIKQAYIRSQIAENESQARARDRQAAQQQRVQDILSNAFGLGGAAGGPGGSAAAGGGQPSAQQAASAFGLTLPQVAALKASGGPDLLEVYKYATDGVKREAGATYVNPVTGQREYVPKVGEGVTMQNGMASAIPGYADAQASIAGATTAANERAKYPYSVGMARENASIGANNDLVTLNLPTGPVQLTRAQALQMTNGAPAVGGGQALTPELRDLIARDAAANGISDPRTAFEGAGRGQAYGVTNAPPQGPGIPLQTPAQAAADLKMAQGRAEQQLAKEAKGTQANDLLGNIGRARELLSQGPTASGAGTLADQAGSFLGVSSKSAQAASALRNIGEWMTSNVPRMEGPQSNFDAERYKAMAGMVGDSTKPVADRLAALNEVEKIQQKYQAGSRPQGQLLQSLPTANASNRGQRIRDTTTGKILKSNGMTWVEE